MTEVSLTPMMSFSMLSSRKCISVNKKKKKKKRENLSILITLCFCFKYIENIMFYLSVGVLIYMYKQSNTVYCLSHSHLELVSRIYFSYNFLMKNVLL